MRRKTEAELHSSFPESTRQSVKPHDFADFVVKLREAGLVEGSTASAISGRFSSGNIPAVSEQR